QRRHIVHDPERSSHRRHHEVAVMDFDVGDWRRRKIHLQRLPVLALIEGDVRALQRSGVEETFLLRILADDVHRLVGWNAVGAVGSPETTCPSGPFAVTSGLNLVQCTPPSIVLCTYCEPW